ncbi:O-antigen ligase family protein [Streptomyces sp. NBC_01803]|uniref:O-antigen ligase family protein n=1 Tax=Streptomyces sp. NBC_01803 TaxID=2975946 RepID=UPI002DDC400C|nr:O-antigen ligase family protein [Streptomyces sp. NBC_01803]WSA46809.1 O-antigen ligase family protein [Streptomyces sp. NBC_01803]
MPGSLPRWPLYALFVAFPLWWTLGLGDMIWPLVAIPMTVLLLRHGELRAPKGFGLWLLFLVWLLASGIQIDTGGRMIGFLYRALIYLAATVIFLYVYNGTERDLPARRVALVLTAYWAAVIAGGYLGVLLPHGSLDTPMAHLVPQGLQRNELVAHMVNPRFSQGNPDGFWQNEPRPSAPFAYTNGWGHNYAELIPFVLVALAHLRRGPMFRLILVLLPVSLVPAFLTVNRGMFVALGLGLGYAALRMAGRGNAKGLLALGTLLVAALGVNLAIGVQDRVSDRVSNSETNQTRLAVYQEAYERTLDSPLFGYGAPRPSVLGEGVPAVGTQGQFWNVLFSHGFVGAGLFLGWFLWLCWRTRRAPTGTALWTHVVVVMTTVMIFYYGLMDSGLVIVMIAGALALREAESHPPVRARAAPLLAPEPVPAPL